MPSCCTFWLDIIIVSGYSDGELLFNSYLYVPFLSIILFLFFNYAVGNNRTTREVLQSEHSCGFSFGVTVERKCGRTFQALHPKVKGNSKQTFAVIFADCGPVANLSHAMCCASSFIIE